MYGRYNLHTPEAVTRLFRVRLGVRFGWFWDAGVCQAVPARGSAVGGGYGLGAVPAGSGGRAGGPGGLLRLLGACRSARPGRGWVGWRGRVGARFWGGGGADGGPFSPRRAGGGRPPVPRPVWVASPVVATSSIRCCRAAKFAV